MKIAGALLILVLSQNAPYAAAGALDRECMRLAQETGELVKIEYGRVTMLCGAGRQLPSLEASKEVIQTPLFNPKNHRALTIYLEQMGLGKGIIVKTLIELIYRTLDEMRDGGSYNYAAADMLFKQLEEALSSLDWDNTESYHFLSGCPECGGNIYYLSGMARQHGAHWGAKVIDMLFPFVEKYPERSIIVDVIIDNLRGLISSDRRVLDTEIPSWRDQNSAANELLQLFRQHGDKISTDLLLLGERENIARIAPDVLIEIDLLNAEKKRRRDEIEKNRID